MQGLGDLFRLIALNRRLVPHDCSADLITQGRANCGKASALRPSMPIPARSASASALGEKVRARCHTRRVRVRAAATVTCWPTIVRTRSSNGDHAPSKRMLGAASTKGLRRALRRKTLTTARGSAPAPKIRDTRPRISALSTG